MSQDVLSSHRIVFRVARICDHLQHPRAQSLDPGDRRGSFLGSVSCILHFVNNEYLGFFVVAILITIYSEIWARILKTPATTVLMPTVIPLIQEVPCTMRWTRLSGVTCRSLS